MGSFSRALAVLPAAASRLLSEIDGPFHSGKGGGWIIMEPELHLNEQVLGF